MSFDFIVHRRDQKTGQVVEIRPYKYVVSREGSYYEREGIRYDAAGKVVGSNVVQEAVVVTAPAVEPDKEESAKETPAKRGWR